MNTAEQMSLFYIVPTEKKERTKYQRKEAKRARRVHEVLHDMQQISQELNTLLQASPYQNDRITINSPADAAALVQYQLSALEWEELHIMLLDNRNHVKGVAQVYRGSVNSSQVRVGEVFREAIRHAATALIVIHNHPSGDPTPSPDDVAVTRAFVQAGKLLDIEVLDHLVIGKNRWCSLKERGLGFS